MKDLRRLIPATAALALVVAPAGCSSDDNDSSNGGSSGGNLSLSEVVNAYCQKFQECEGDDDWHYYYDSFEDCISEYTEHLQYSDDPACHEALLADANCTVAHGQCLNDPNSGNPYFDYGAECNSTYEKVERLCYDVTEE